MTGMDVLRRCSEYEKDMARLRLRIRCAKDAVTRLTRSTDTSGHGGGEDKMSAYVGRLDELERALIAREEQYIRDVELAARLVARIDPMQGQAIHLRMVCGLTIRQTAAELRTSESSVRGLCRRGQEALERIKP